MKASSGAVQRHSRSRGQVRATVPLGRGRHGSPEAAGWVQGSGGRVQGGGCRAGAGRVQGRCRWRAAPGKGWGSQHHLREALTVSERSGGPTSSSTNGTGFRVRQARTPTPAPVATRCRVLSLEDTPRSGLPVTTGHIPIFEELRVSSGAAEINAPARTSLGSGLEAASISGSRTWEPGKPCVSLFAPKQSPPAPLSKTVSGRLFSGLRTDPRNGSGLAL